jgi:hypothetical protein
MDQRMDQRMEACTSVATNKATSFTAINARPTLKMYSEGPQHSESTERTGKGMTADQCATDRSQISHNETKKWTSCHISNRQTLTVSD